MGSGQKAVASYCPLVTDFCPPTSALTIVETSPAAILKSMFSHLSGTVHKQQPGIITLDVQGVGYLVAVPLSVWDELEKNEEARLHIATYIREDRFDLFGFQEASDRLLFEECMKMSGVGPSLGLELCSVPRNLLLQAINDQDPGVLTNIKGIGKKRAEKVLVDLKSVIERHPALFAAASVKEGMAATFDQDAVEALTALGYDHGTSMQALKDVPKDLKTTEERVKAALQSL